ncbi:MAG: hypothetical protein ACLFO2_00835 [Candidatus Woesearchaeota archaeon]
MRYTPPSKVFLLVAALLLSVTAVAASDINVTIDERGKIVSFYDQYYIYQLNGTVSITNPSNHTLNNVELPLYVSTLDVRTNYSKTYNYMSPSEIYVYKLGPESTETFNYRLVGISTEDLSKDGDSVLANGIEMLQPKVYSNLMGSLKKAPLEDPAYTGRDARLISVELRNPTDYEYNIEKVEVIKTDEMDPNAELDHWSFTGDKEVLDPYEGWDFDFIDKNASEGEVYWLSTDIFIDRILINASSNISRFDQDDLFFFEPNATLNESYNESVPLLSDRVYLRKTASTTLMTPGQVVNMTVLVNNLEPRSVSFTVRDRVPSGFEVLGVDDGRMAGRNATWNVTLSAGSAKRLKYRLRYEDPDTLGLDYFPPATLTYKGKEYHSQNIPFIRKHVPEKRVFVQKRVKFLSGDSVRVTLSVQNLGESSLENVMLKDHLLSTAEFREITQNPVERGTWRIGRLNRSSTWETTYVTDRMSVFNAVPELYGVPRSAVMQTVILSNFVSSSFSIVSTHAVEIIGIVSLIIIFVLYFVPPSYFSRTKRRQQRDLRLMSGELRSLRDKTDYHNQSLEQEPQRQAGPALRPEQTEPQPRRSFRDDPHRQRRHESLEKTAEKLEGVKKELKGSEEEGGGKKKES